MERDKVSFKRTFILLKNTSLNLMIQGSKKYLNPYISLKLYFKSWPNLSLSLSLSSTLTTVVDQLASIINIFVLHQDILILIKSNHISPCILHIYFYTKNLLFLFYTFTFSKYPHQFIYFDTSFIKIINILNFFIISSTTYARVLSLSLSFSETQPIFLSHFYLIKLSLSLSL